jgi:hypothetical protein
VQSEPIAACPELGELRRDLCRLREHARDLVLLDWWPIHALADVLRVKSILSGQEAEAILDAARRELASHMPAAPGTPDGAGGSVEGVEYANSAVA